MLRKVEYDHLNSPLKLCACGCGQKIHSITWKGLPQTYKHGHHLKGNQYGWKGGKTLSPSGYVLIKKSDHPFAHTDGYIREHRLVWEEHYNAMLLPWGFIHHKDGNKKNNVWYNLQGTMADDHARHHAKGRKKIWYYNRRTHKMERVEKYLTRAHVHHSR